MQQSVLDIKQVTLEEVSLRILDIVKKIAGFEDMQLSDEIVGYNLSSLKIIRLLGAIEETYPITINFADFIDKNTIQDFCEWVYSQLKLDMESNHSDLWGIQNFSENRYEEFELTNIQTAYLMGRDKQFELGGISTHAYLEIQTELDMEKLNVSLQKVIDRQDMLRAYFLPNGKQRVLEKVAPYKIPIEDVSSLSEGELEGVILKERDRMSHFVFDPFKWPLFEFKALRLMENKYYLFFGIDMLIADGASIQILFKEIFEHYYCNSNSEIKPLEINYRDYMLSYSQIKETKKYQEDKEFWEKKLSDFPQAPQLPLTNNLEAVTKPTFIRRSKIYHHEQWANIVKECSKHNIRPTMFLLTCYAKALAKWSNQSEFILNTTVFNRYPVHKDVNQIIGDFTSLLLIDIHLDEKGEIWSEACKIQNHFLEAFEHRDYDGIDFSRELMKIHNYSKGKAIAPIVFTSMLFDDEFQGIDVIGKLKYGISQTSQVYLDHQIIEVGNGIMLSWDYISELFEEQIIEEMFEEYIHIVESAVNSEVEVSPRSLHLKQLLENYNQTSLHREPDTLHNMFIQGVQRTPSHIAIEGYEKAITYKELDITSNKIASYLIRTGVKPGEFVGVLAEREWETIANILGVLKVGAAYVPIGEDLPEDRKEYMLRDSGCHLLLTASMVEELCQTQEEFTEIVHNPYGVAYVIYTSGSTGKPKGVVIKHQAACNTIKDINERFQVEETDKILGLSSMTFDLSVYDVFGALSTGATLVMVRDQRDVRDVYKIVVEKGITIWNSVPMVMEMLVNYMDEKENHQYQTETKTMSYDELPDLRLVLLSGDWIPVQLPDRIKHHFLDSEVISLGGATEASIWSIYYPIKDVPKEWKSIPYGYPLTNQTYYVLNYAGELCPVGVKGELHIGGMGLAEGYLNDEVKTKLSFFEHPEYGRLYKTGDMGVFTPEGYIEFLGRKDYQIKIRGYRVELGEIESILQEHRKVRNAVVIHNRDQRGQEALFAYLVSEDLLDMKELRDYIGAKVPSYMVPSYMKEIEEIPLTPNGKIDRKKLLDLPFDENESMVERFLVSARTDTEKKLTGIWKEVLELKEISIYDNFFEIGGNSILIIRLITAIEEAFSVKIDFRSFIRNSSIEQLAKLIELRNPEKEVKKEYFPPVTPNQQDRYREFELTNVQMAYLMGRDPQFELGGTSTHAYLEIKSQLDLEKFNDSLQKVIDRQDMLRAVILPNGKQQVLKNVPPYKIQIEDVRDLSEQDQYTVIVRERDRMSHHIFDPNQWPLFEFKAVRLSDEHYQLFFGIDMLIADGASIQMLFKEIAEYYSGHDEKMKPLEITFRDYMASYKQIKETERYQEDKAYWMKKLKDFPAAPQLPLKDKLENIHGPTFNRKAKLINGDTWGKICEMAAQHNVIPAMVLFTAYTKVLSKWSNQPSLAINTTIFNRQALHKDVNEIIGDFTSLMMLDVHFEQNGQFWKEAEKIQYNFMEALEHRHYDGVDFIREYADYHGLSHTSATMPVVFTSMLFGKTFDLNQNLLNLGELQMAVSQTSQVYLDHQIIEVGNGIMLSWDYISELFEEQIIEEMFEEYIHIVESVVKGAMEVSTGDLHLKQLMEKYNQTSLLREPDTLHNMFIQGVRRTPSHIAIEGYEKAITYKELDITSNKIASYLIRNGVKPGEFVGVLAEREWETIANILGVLKAGAAYVPIGQDLPEDRKEYMLRDSGCHLLLTASMVDELCKTHEEFTEIVHNPSGVAYVIYTSGSTGKPKGVVIKHQAACNTIKDINERFQVEETDKILGLSSMTFDLSVYDVFGALSTGATLVMVRDQRDVREVYKIVLERGITIWNSVPMVMEMLVNYMDEKENRQYQTESKTMNYDELPDLRLVLLSGDWIPVQLPDRIKHHFLDSEVISLGGATEASIWSIYYPIKDVPKEWKSIPYGYPLTNQTYYVLNYAGELCPVGVKGELHIGGMGLAESYLNDEVKTKSSFFEHPEYGRLYKTGDMGVFTPEGYIEFLGRKDYQIKIRGYRVELGEIESILQEHRKVRNAVVIHNRDQRGQEALFAYLVSEDLLDMKELRDYIEAKVPSYMVPSYMKEIEEIPLTPNGKIDRKKLLAIPTEGGDSIKERFILEARTETEKKLIEIWKEVLELEDVSIRDNFFELGGNSILLTKIFSKLEETYTHLNIVDLFKYQNIEQFSEYIDKKTTETIYEIEPIPIPTSLLNKNVVNAKKVVFDHHIIVNPEHPGLRDIVINTYLYTLSSLTNHMDLKTCFKIAKNDHISYEKVTVNSYKSIEDLKEKIEKGQLRREQLSSYHFEQKPNVRQNSESLNITALFIEIDGDVYTNYKKLLNYYDIIFSYRVIENQLQISLAFGNGKLLESAMEKFFSISIKILSELIQK